MEHLHQLIQNLSRSEKRYYSLYAKGNRSDSVLLQLFDAISKQPTYDEEVIKKRFKKARFVDQLTVTKNHLYESILKAMRQYHADKSVESQLVGLMQDVDLLMEKQLYDQCLKKLKKAKSIAGENDLHEGVVVLLGNELQLMAAKFYKGVDDKEIEALTKEYEDLLEQLEELITIRGIEAKLFRHYYMYRKDRMDPAYIKKLMKSPYLKDENKLKSFKAKLHFYNIHAQYNNLMLNPEKTYEYRKRMLEAIEENPGKSKNLLAEHIKAINNMTNAAMATGKFDEAKDLIHRFRNIGKMYPKNFMTIESETKIFVHSYILELVLSRASGDPELGFDTISRSDEEIDRFAGKMDVVLLFHLYILAANIYFENGYYEETIDRVNKILNHDRAKNHQNVLHTALLLQLLSQLELEELQLLEYLHRSTYRKLKQMERLDEQSADILRFVNRWVMALDKKEKLELLESIYPEWSKWKNVAGVNIKRWLAYKRDRLMGGKAA